MFLLLFLSVCKKKMVGYTKFLAYKNFETMTYNDLQYEINYICRNLNSPTMNYPYWYGMYSYTSKSLMVMQWRKEKGFKEHARLGEVVCDGVLVSFLKEK